ncbi:class I SAM-dependent methyltransferase [Anaerocolumna aminovalerica]|nr:class I SAM-dependent methyltransferase [Anaerocolumna aminovalerica]MBU5330855.1 class I SAM-dependent methyltransferase [Anaerocolumna aminovalerica]
MGLIPNGDTILDAACGTGKYWSIITAKGYNVLGID